MYLSLVLLKLCVCPSFSFGIAGVMWDVTELIPDHCLSIDFVILPEGMYLVASSERSLCIFEVQEKTYKNI